jgi:hypothetical protein
MREKEFRYNVLDRGLSYYYHLPENSIPTSILCTLLRSIELRYSQLLSKVLYSLFHEKIPSYRELKELLKGRGYFPSLPQPKRLREEVGKVLGVLRDMGLIEYVEGRYSLSEKGRVLARELCRKQIYQD